MFLNGLHHFNDLIITCALCVKTDLFIEIKPERLKKQQKTNSQKKKLIAKKHSTKAQVKHKTNMNISNNNIFISKQI